MSALIQELRELMTLEGFGCACEPQMQCGTCRARGILSKTLGPLILKHEPLEREAAAEIERLRKEAERMRAALERITHFTSATPSLSESGCGRLLAQIEHEATRARRTEG